MVRPARDKEQSEVERNAGVNVPAERIPGARVGIAVARTGWAKVRTVTTGITGSDQRRIIVEDVVHAQAEIIVIAERVSGRQIEIFLGRDVQLGLEVEIAVQRFIILERLGLDLADVPPLERDAD